MLEHKTKSVKNRDKKFSSRHAKMMDGAARRWLAQVEEDASLSEAAQPTDDERKRLEEAQAAIAAAMGFSESLTAIRDIEQARISRVQQLIDSRRKKGRKRGGES